MASNSKCVYEVTDVLKGYDKTAPVVGKLLKKAIAIVQRDVDATIGRLMTQGPVAAQKQWVDGVDIAFEEAQKRFTKQSEFPEAFVRPGDVPILAEKGKIYQREAQQAGIMNQYGLAPAYARISAIPRSYPKNKPIEGMVTQAERINLFVDQLALHDVALRLTGLPLVTSKAGALKGSFSFSYLTFGDVMKMFKNTGNFRSIGKYFLRSPDATKNVQNQNLAEAVRRVLEHADNYGKIDLDADYDLLKAQVVDALRNPSGLGKPKKGQGLEEYEKATSWANSKEGMKLTDELADELLSDAMIPAIIKGNEEMRLLVAVTAKADGMSISGNIIKAIIDLPHVNERNYGFGDLLFNDRFRKEFTNDALVKMTPEELNLVFGENYIAQFFNELSEDSLNMIRAQYRRTTGKNKDRKTRNTEQAKADKKSNRQENVNQVFKDEVAEIAPKAAQKASKDMEDGNVVVQESSLEAAELARAYELELGAGPLLGNVVRAFNWVSDKAAMGGKMKAILTSGEHWPIENAANMATQLSKLFRASGESTKLVNDAFRALQTNVPLKAMPEAQRAIAEKMAPFIEKIFGYGTRNNLDMNGVFSDEFTEMLERLGVKNIAEDVRGLDGYAKDELGEWWKKLQVGDDQNALTVMSKVYSAMHLSRMKPSIASSLVYHFSHTSEGLTRDQAVKLGYRPVADTTPLARFMNSGEKPPLFHPDIIRGLAAVNAHLEYERGFNPKWQKFWDKVDPTVGVLKSSLTIWRPGHHMVSLMGNTLFNQLMGVTANDYAAAARMLVKRGDVLDLDEDVLTQALRAGTPDGYKLKGNGETWDIVINGKVEKVPIELLLRAADEIGGIPISPRRTKDLPNDMSPENFGVERGFTKLPFIKQIVATDSGLAHVAAVRDNIGRYALYMRELRRGGYKSIEDAVLAAAQKVHEVHPTVGTLTAGERKFARRAFYFYTWQKQALFKIMELAANQPGWITMPSKAQYALATAQGLNPESFGDGWDPEGLYASYFTNSVFGPQIDDPELGAVGFKPASPQLDILDAFFSKATARGGLGFWEAMGEASANMVGGVIGSNATPLYKIPTELLQGRRMDGQVIDNIPEYLLDNTGIGIISRMAGYTPWGTERSDIKEGEFGEQDRIRQRWNYVFGVKTTFYESPQAVEIARKERIDYWQRIYKTGKYAEDK